MAKAMKKLDSKLQKQQQGWPKISNAARKYNKDTTAKFKCTREHILGLDWLTKITWHKRAREVSSEFVKFKTSSPQIFHVYIINKIHEKITRFWLAESSAVQV